MHLADIAKGVMGASAVVGHHPSPMLLGMLMPLNTKKKDSLVVSFFGDGATDEGVFYESLNFAALKKTAGNFCMRE